MTDWLQLGVTVLVALVLIRLVIKVSSCLIKGILLLILLGLVALLLT